VEISDMHCISTVYVGTVRFESFRVDVSLICLAPDKNNSNMILLQVSYLLNCHIYLLRRYILLPVYPEIIFLFFFPLLFLCLFRIN